MLLHLLTKSPRNFSCEYLFFIEICFFSQFDKVTVQYCNLLISAKKVGISSEYVILLVKAIPTRFC